MIETNWRSFIKKKQNTFSIQTDRKSEDKSIKKSICFLFQTIASSTVGPGFRAEVLEDDDLGQHFTEYKLGPNGENKNVKIVEKEIKSDNFVRFQLDSINFQQIEINSRQQQEFQTNGNQGDIGIVLKRVNGSVVTSSTTKQKELPVQIRITFKMEQLAWKETGHGSRVIDKADYVHFTRDNFTQHEFDETANLLQVYKRKNEKWGDLPQLDKIFSEIWANPSKLQRQSNFYPPIFVICSVFQIENSHSST